jgi:choline dehydrogenase-like flavoprotein
MGQALLTGTGAATDVPSGFMAFVKTRPELAIPDVQYLFRSGPAGAGPWFPGIRKAWQDAYACRAMLLRPQSRGRISLRSADPLESVRIEQNFLSHPDDLPVLRSGLKMLRDVARQSPLDEFRGREIGPGAGVTSDDDLDRYIRATASTAHHPCGTARMGADELAVVDGALRVRGVRDLRIADASVMPDLVGGNINRVLKKPLVSPAPS